MRVFLFLFVFNVLTCPVVQASPATFRARIASLHPSPQTLVATAHLADGVERIRAREPGSNLTDAELGLFTVDLAGFVFNLERSVEHQELLVGLYAFAEMARTEIPADVPRIIAWLRRALLAHDVLGEESHHSLPYAARPLDRALGACQTVAGATLTAASVPLCVPLSLFALLDQEGSSAFGPLRRAAFWTRAGYWRMTGRAEAAWAVASLGPDKPHNAFVCAALLH